MSVQLKKIKSPVIKELEEFNTFFYNSLKSKVSLLDTILKYIVKQKGKQVRPLFVLLSAGLNGQINQKTYRGAALIELLHTASLVHDDVVDDSMQRRGVFSINALWKNKISVLIGDYLLSRGMLLALNNKDYETLEITSEAVKMMSEGELLQIEKARTLDIKEDVYFKIIKMKTASLIASSCAIGAASVEASEMDQNLMKEFGENTGIAFQIKDDLLDFSTDITGKPKGTDLKEKKLTLPLIYALKKADKSEKKRIINLISRHHKKKDTYHTVIRFIEENKGFEYAIQLMNEYRQKALDNLKPFPDNAYKQSLTELVNFTVDRKK
ncbi:MAG: polyprenyl synthetase family protein [Bacteroidetes bacterium]|jgi:octaprenyl-diphosphate synthase|nr:polyprenyl synthetase family protein [Bacteroidota bacterium]MBT5528444.1 polyprenyl synthetase family protein [Cytophagia bacterium]MBT3421948.1 polyprenyl synthetase family protein [Bacteroidota bacterium]MBT3802073.1 polyprenyl synthetase family protein [Bacteroidota bacterium]MBT3933706.1 polyprenyl synthetase family protein [Bacteroidota bacterium]